MSWDTIIGQRRAKTAIRAALASERLPHAWLFTGAEGTGKDAAAIEVARYLRCDNRQPQGTPCDACRGCATTAALQNLNVRFVFALPTGKGEDGRADAPMLKLTDAELTVVQEQIALKAKDPYHNVTIPRAQQIKISSIREIKREFAYTTTEPGWRVVIISEAHLMGEEAANAFLKTLEEPAPQTLLILTSSHRERILPTILSRCQEIRFELLNDEEVATALVERNGAESINARLIAKLSSGSYSRGVELLSGDLNQLRHDVISFLRAALRRSPQAVHGEIERLTGNADRTRLERTLALLQLWLRDAYALRLTGREDLVINSDQLKDIQSFNSKFASAPLEEMIGDIEKTIRAIRSNAQISLAFIVLSMRLMEGCYRKENPGVRS
jgi:DNA polymerase-3 subunit delta'